MRTDGLCRASSRAAHVFVLVLLACGISRAQYREQIQPATQPLSGLLRLDLSSGDEQQKAGTTAKAKATTRLSPFRAAVFSAVVPGVGQAYARSYWQAAGFFAVEVVGWFIYAKNHANGNDRESQFKDYADANWSVVRYAHWTFTNFPAATTGLTESQIYSSDPTLKPWDAVNWSLLNELEYRVAALGVNGYTHTLPARPNQQYYEEIGKYPQFGSGWDDAGGFVPGDILTSNVSAHFLHYRDMRGEANQFYNNATAAAYVLVANHVFSALAAAWNASRKNHQIGLQGSLVPIQRDIGWVELVPTARLRVDL